jgi:hypothetical protein
MTKKSKLNWLLSVLASLVTVTVALPVAAAECPKLADVEWWTNTVPEVRRVVLNTYEGSWDAYIDRWQLQRKELQEAYDHGSPVEIKSRGLVFRDDDLKNYVKMVDERRAEERQRLAEVGRARGFGPRRAAAGSREGDRRPEPRPRGHGDLRERSGGVPGDQPR